MKNLVNRYPKTLMALWIGADLLLIWPALVVPHFIWGCLWFWGLTIFAIADEPGSRGWVCRLANRRGWTALYERYKDNELSYWHMGGK